jgi:predicted PurR-regulated permease PerM
MAMPTNLKPEVRGSPISFYILLGGVVFIFIKTFSVLSPIFLSFLLILLFSLAINPVITRMMPFTGGRKVATGIVATAVILILGLTGWAFVGPLKNSTAKISEKLPNYWERLEKPLMKLEQPAASTDKKTQMADTNRIPLTVTATNAHETAPPTTTPGQSKTTEEPESARSGLSHALQAVASGLKPMALSVSQIVVVFITVFFGVTFTLMNPLPIFGAIFAMVHEGSHEKTLTILQRVGRFVPNWAFGTLMSMLAVGVLVFLLMWPVLGFLDALVLGLIAGIFEAVPYLGPLLSAVPALFFALAEGGMTPIWVLLIYLGVQLVENNVISPLIMARSMELHPVAVIFSMLICVDVFGILGVLVATPMVAIVEILHDELYRKRFLPSVTDGGLHRLAQKALQERPSVTK